MNTDLIFSALKLLLALPLVILLAVISLRLTNRYLNGRQNAPNGIRVLERIPIHNGMFLCIVKIFNEYMVLGVGENSISHIKTLEPEEVKEYLSGKEQSHYPDIWKSTIARWVRRDNLHE
ncbi:MAG: flagellar biosynthetic protein FliO [Caldicoprobacterales bacterium]